MDSGLAVRVVRTIAVGRAAETNSALLILRRKTVSAGIAGEANSAFAVSVPGGNAAVAAAALAASVNTAAVLAASRITDTPVKGEIDAT